MEIRTQAKTQKNSAEFAQEAYRILWMDEQQLMTRHKNGDEAAFAELLLAYRRPVYGYLIRCGVPAAIRDDLVQEIFLKIHTASTEYQPERPLKAWVFTIVANTVRTFYRKQSAWSRYFNKLQTTKAEVALPSSQEITEAKQTADYLYAALSRLSAAQRQTLLLHVMAGLEHQEIASALRLPIGTVKTYIHRARETLAKALLEQRARHDREAL